MKISEIDKDLEDLIYYLDKKGFKPFASCDGVIANHENAREVSDAYIDFLKSPRILEMMAILLGKSKDFQILIGNEDHLTPPELYGNIIEGTTYQVSFENKNGERTAEFTNIIRNIVEQKIVVPDKEQKMLAMLEKTLEDNVNPNVAFKVILNGEYQPHMCKRGRINQLYIHTVVGEERREGNIIITTERDMDMLAQLIAKQYGMVQRKENFTAEYPEDEFVMATNDRCACSVYFTDEHFLQVLEQIGYIREIAHTLPTFEGKEWIGSDEELYEEDYDLQEREEMLQKLEEEAEKLSQEEKRILKLNGQTIGE